MSYTRREEEVKMRSRIAAGSLVLALTSVLLVSLTMSALADTPHSSIVIDDLLVPQGGTATVSITITEATNNISSVDLELTYDTAVVVLVNVTNSDFDNFFWNEPTPGQVKMLGFQGASASLTVPVKVADLTFQGVGGAGANTSLTLEGCSYMGTGSPYGNITLSSGSGYIAEGVPVFNTVGMVALVGLFALVLVVTARRKKDE
jgi:hypothetical protein